MKLSEIQYIIVFITEIINNFVDKAAQPTRRKERELSLVRIHHIKEEKALSTQRSKEKEKPSNYEILAPTMQAHIVLTQ